MNNRHLARKVDNTQSEVSSILLDLVEEIESLERINDDLNETNAALSNQISDLEEQIANLQTEINSHK